MTKKVSKKQFRRLKCSYRESELKLTKENIINYIIEVAKVFNEIKSETPHHYGYMPYDSE